MSNCAQIRNSVVRVILQGCPVLEDIRLDRCHRITDSAFDFSESPFQFLLGCLSLEAISLQVLLQSQLCVMCGCEMDNFDDTLNGNIIQLLLLDQIVSLFSRSMLFVMCDSQGCPQITGEIISTLNKHCRRLTHLNLSQVRTLFLFSTSQSYVNINLCHCSVPLNTVQERQVPADPAHI